MIARHIQVLLADDSPAFLEVLRRFLAGHPRVAVIGSASSGREAVEQVSRLRPDLVLLDLVMPEMSGLEALERIRVLPAGPRVIILAFGNEPEFRTAAKALGADGFVSKAEMAGRLFPVIDGLFPSATEEADRNATGHVGETLAGGNRVNGEG